MSEWNGETLRLAIFGASHAPETGMVLDGIPAGRRIDRVELLGFLARRAPGRNAWSSARTERDEPVFTGGVAEECSGASGADGNAVLTTDGGPIRAVLPNRDARSSDYEEIRYTPRPGHADYTAYVKYGGTMDMSGGGPFSGRMTAPLCVAGGICRQLLREEGIRVFGRVASAGGIADEGELTEPVETKPFPTVSDARGDEMIRAIERAKEDGDSLGGTVECVVTGLPAGLGGPLFEGLEGRIAELVLAIPAAKGVEFGAGFDVALLRGSEANDAFRVSRERAENGAETARVITKTNRAGGILGGISNGMPLVLRAAFKPTPSIAKEQETVDLRTMTETTVRVRGRHDPCVVPRAVPCVEAAVSVALLDALLAFRREKSEGAAAAPTNQTKPASLASLRARIDAADRRLCDAFAERMAVSAEIAAYKKENGIPVLDPAREREKLDEAAANVPEELREDVRTLYRTLFELSRNAQSRLTGGEDETR